MTLARRNLFASLAALLCLTSPAASCREATPPIIAAADTLFFDDFSAPTLDRSKWNVYVTGTSYNAELQAYIDAPRTLSITHDDSTLSGAGALVLTAQTEAGFATADGRHFDFTSARIDTRGKVEFRYGTVAARIRVASGSGLWPAFWLLGDGEWPQTGEIDIMENVGDPTWTNVAAHGPGYSGNTPFAKRQSFPGSSDATGWHVYSASWYPDSIVFFVDSARIYRVTRAQTSVYGTWAFDNRKYIVLNLAVGGSYPAAVNGVTLPYFGLPATTVDRIRAGRASFLVDWIRVISRPESQSQVLTSGH